jgi:hypothetical protein
MECNQGNKESVITLPFFSLRALHARQHGSEPQSDYNAISRNPLHTQPMQEL